MSLSSQGVTGETQLTESESQRVRESESQRVRAALQLDLRLSGEQFHALRLQRGDSYISLRCQDTFPACEVSSAIDVLLSLLYVEEFCPGGGGPRGPRGDHIMRMMALLSRVPSWRTRRVGGGQDGGSQESKICLRGTKDTGSVVLGLNELSLDGELFILWPPMIRPFEYHTRSNRALAEPASEVASM
ncbi:unnamed protein product [Pleuronectes platessa]|uniref:Uncharacterized protein n=1 Tax=Pleuronectes platessa TaxID=8262 RepID=A0A9N7VKV6_PLEPL|nr:unnamed protein product [Pleuronectes platessa]